MAERGVGLVHLNSGTTFGAAARRIDIWGLPNGHHSSVDLLSVKRQSTEGTSVHAVGLAGDTALPAGYVP